MTPSELKAQVKEQHEERDALKVLWLSLMQESCPDDQQLNVWLGLHDFERIVYSVRRTASKHLKLERAMTLEHAVRFCSKVANTRKTEQEEHTK